MASQLLAFSAVAAVLTITPGADMALVTKNALTGGTQAALATTVGIVVGCFAWAIASTLGIAALISASATAFTLLKLVGAAYLGFLGLQAILAARARLRRDADSEERGPTSTDAAVVRHPFRQALTTDLLNPKIAVLYTTVLPQFISPGDPVMSLSLTMAAIHGLMGLACSPSTRGSSSQPGRFCGVRGFAQRWTE